MECTRHGNSQYRRQSNFCASSPGRVRGCAARNETKHNINEILTALLIQRSQTTAEHKIWVRVRERVSANCY